MKYDMRMIKDFLMHLAAALGLQQLRLEGRPAGAKLLQGVQQLQAKYGTTLLRAVEGINLITNIPEDSDEIGQEPTQQAMARVRADQIDHVIAVIGLLDQLTIAGSKRE
jgi:hypothetical protein